MRKANGSKRISAEERALAEQVAAIQRRRQELEKRLKVIPAVLEAQQEQQRAIAKERAAAAGPALSPTFGRGGRRARGRVRGRPLPSRDRFATQVKTFGWLLILAVIIFMLIKAIPTS